MGLAHPHQEEVAILPLRHQGSNPHAGSPKEEEEEWGDPQGDNRRPGFYSVRSREAQEREAELEESQLVHPGWIQVGTMGGVRMSLRWENICSLWTLVGRQEKRLMAVQKKSGQMKTLCDNCTPGDWRWQAQGV